MLLNCGVGEDSWESLGLQGDPTSLSKGDQSWMFIGRNDVEAETPILWPPDAKSWLIGKDPDTGKDWEQEEKGMTADEMVGWHHQLTGNGFGWTPRVGDWQGGLECCGSWGHKESDTTELLNWTDYVYWNLGSSGKKEALAFCKQCICVKTPCFLRSGMPCKELMMKTGVWKQGSPAWYTKSLQSCLTLCDSHDPPGFSVQGILQARTLEWVAISFSRGSSWPRDQAQVSCIPGRFFASWATKGRFSNQGRDLIYLIFLELWLLMYSTSSRSQRTRAGEKERIPPHLSESRKNSQQIPKFVLVSETAAFFPAGHPSGQWTVQETPMGSVPRRIWPRHPSFACSYEERMYCMEKKKGCEQDKENSILETLNMRRCLGK